VRYDSAITSVSWIPSEAMTGPMRLPMDLGMGHYDEPPPDRIDDFAAYLETDQCRFINNLSAWVEVEDGRIVDHGYAGTGYVGVTTIKLGVGALTVPGMGYPVLQTAPELGDGGVRFTQTAGGRTGAPLPRRTSRPPYLRIVGPTAWTTLSLTIGADGAVTTEVAGASPFPRHWIYDADGRLMAKSGVIDFKEWTREHSHDNSPWNDADRTALVAEVESELERQLSRRAMTESKPEFRSVAAGDALVRQGEIGDELFLVLDGMLLVEVDGEAVAEVGPGALLGERALLEGGVRTSTLTASTPTRVAVIDPSLFTTEELSGVAAGHRREAD
jgi:hypothetical protein